MQNAELLPLRAVQRPRRRAPFVDLLKGYRFEVCGDADAAEAALAVRRQVYVEECRHDIPIPDEYDARSWLLRAVEVDTGRTVGSLRVTARSAGPIEAEEYFGLPRSVADSPCVEVSRFAILPECRHSGRFFPVVALGLLKLGINFVRQLNVPYVVVCAKPERVWSYEWIQFQRTGIVGSYRKLGGAVHELLVADVRAGYEQYRSHRHWRFFMGIDSREVHLPGRIPTLGIHETTPAAGVRSAAGRSPVRLARPHFSDRLLGASFDDQSCEPATYRTNGSTPTSTSSAIASARSPSARV